MLISVQTAQILDNWGIDEGFGMIAAAGFDGVDINIDHCLSYGEIVGTAESRGFFDRSDADMLESARPYKEAAQKHGVKFVQAHAPFPNMVHDEARNAYVLMAVKKTIMICGYLGCPRLIVHPGFLPTDERLTPQQEWDWNIAMYSALIPELKQYGVICCLENMFSRHRSKLTEAICSDPHEAARYIDALNGVAGEERFGFCLDTGHANLLGKDMYTFIHVLGGRLRALHVHDNDGTDDEHLFPYMGIADWDRFCRALKETGYREPLSFETFNALKTFDRALTPQLLSLLHATGELFVSRIEG